MHQFFVYREYGAKYETMIKDVTSALESLPEWEAHQKGLEAFAFTIGAAPSSNDRKSLTIGDLLVKVRPPGSPASTTNILPSAHSKGLQIPPFICGVVEMYSRHRLPEFSYGS